MAPFPCAGDRARPLFLLAAAALAPFLWLRPPSKTDALHRLDRNSGLRHRPATAMADEMAGPAADSYAATLWHAHMERALAAAHSHRLARVQSRQNQRRPSGIGGRTDPRIGRRRGRAMRGAGSGVRA